MQRDLPTPEIARDLRRNSLAIATRVVAALFGVGSAMGIGPLLSGDGALPFAIPAQPFLFSIATIILLRWERDAAARVTFSIGVFIYVTAVAMGTPPLIKLSIVFPITCLFLLIFHLTQEPRAAWRLGLGLTATVVAGFGLMFATEDSVQGDWTLMTSCVAQVLVMGFANVVLRRLNVGWMEALSETTIARAELASAYQLSVDASQAKSAFLASMSHELRTPLNAVIGYAELADEELQLTGSADRGDLQRIQRAGQHLLDLVNQILDLSRVESGRLELERGEVDLEALVREVCDTLRPQLNRRGNTLKLALGTVHGFEIDALRTKQIVTNLLGNAAKFTENGIITVGLSGEDGEVILFVEDTGPGIPIDRQERIFEPFAQADETVQRTFGGTGLGLAISRRFARAMGGDLFVDSIPGRGSRFSLVLGMSMTAAHTAVHTIPFGHTSAA